jgi:hypothetical protein
MNAACTAAPGQAGERRPGPRRISISPRPIALTCAVLVLAAGCTGKTSAGDDDAAKTIRSLGAVPIPSRPAAHATPVASEHHLQLVAMGEPVRAELPPANAVVVASGPLQDPITIPGKVPDHALSTITVTVSGSTGDLTIKDTDFSSRDEEGKAIRLKARGPASVTASPGHPATLTLAGTYESGAAQLTWRHDGKVVALWDFNIELD